MPATFASCLPSFWIADHAGLRLHWYTATSGAEPYHFQKLGEYLAFVGKAIIQQVFHHFPAEA